MISDPGSELNPVDVTHGPAPSVYISPSDQRAFPNSPPAEVEYIFAMDEGAVYK